MSYTPNQITETIKFLSELILPPELESESRKRKWLENQLTNLIEGYVKLNLQEIKLALGEECLRPLLRGLNDRDLSFPKDKIVLLKISGESLGFCTTEDKVIFSISQRKFHNPLEAQIRPRF